MYGAAERSRQAGVTGRKAAEAVWCIVTDRQKEIEQRAGGITRRKGEELMYMAQMFCYGMDPQCVGITGIVGCIGCVYVGATNLYAVHIPPQDLTRQKNAAAEFAAFVLGGPDRTTVSQGQLHVFVNGRNRNEAADEAHDLRALLHKPETKVYRIMTNLGPESGKLGAAAVSILVKRLSSSIRMTYKHVPDDEYEDGGGAKKSDTR